MLKSKLNSFISKYSLGNNIDRVKVNIYNNILTTGFIAEDKSMFGFVTGKDFDIEDGTFGINDTSKLKGLLNVVGDDISISYLKKEIRNEEKNVALIISDKNNTKVNFMLSDPSILPPSPKDANVPPFEVEIPLNKEFIEKFIKAKSALSEVDNFTFLNEEGVLKLVIGYSTINSNKISLEVKTNDGKDQISTSVNFSAKYFKEILSANIESKDATLYVSGKGLAYVEFGNKDSEFQSKYYLVKVNPQE